MVGGWTKTKLMLFSNQVEVVLELKLELSLAKLLIITDCDIFMCFSNIHCSLNQMRNTSFLGNSRFTFRDDFKFDIYFLIFITRYNFNSELD